MSDSHGSAGFHWINWSIAQLSVHRELAARDKLVLLVLAAKADVDGVSYYGHRKLAGICGISPDTLSKALNALGAHGLLRRTPRGPRTNLYRLLDAWDGWCDACISSGLPDSMRRDATGRWIATGGPDNRSSGRPDSERTTRPDDNLSGPPDAELAVDLPEDLPEGTARARSRVRGAGAATATSTLEGAVLLRDDDDRRLELARSWVRERTPHLPVEDAAQALLAIRRTGRSPMVWDVEQVMLHGLETWEESVS